MKITVAEAVSRLDERGVLDRIRHPQAEEIIPYVEALIGRPLPTDLADLYQLGVAQIVDFDAILPVWNDRVGWRTPDSLVTELLHANAIPLFGDG